MLWGADGKRPGCGRLADERIPGIFTVFASLETHHEAAFQAPACWGLKKFVLVWVLCAWWCCFPPLFSSPSHFCLNHLVLKCCSELGEDRQESSASLMGAQGFGRRCGEPGAGWEEAVSPLNYVL